MPKPRKIPNRTLSREEQRFIGHFVKLGGNPDKVSDCERLAKIKHGEGLKMLKRAHVQEEIERRLNPLHIEQLRQQLLAEAVAVVVAKLAADKLKAEQEAAAAAAETAAMINAPRMAVNTDDLEHELMRLAKHLDMERHPQVKLAAIQAAFVVSGVLENGNIRRVMPKDNGTDTVGNLMYGDLFDTMHKAREMAGQVPRQIEASAEPEIFDLMPHQKLPAAGEAIELPAGAEPDPEPEPEPPPPANRASQKVIRERIKKLTAPSVITVDIG